MCAARTRARAGHGRGHGRERVCLFVLERGVLTTTPLVLPRISACACARVWALVHARACGAYVHECVQRVHVCVGVYRQHHRWFLLFDLFTLVTLCGVCVRARATRHVCVSVI